MRRLSPGKILPGRSEGAPIVAVSNHAILNFILPQVQGGEHGCADTLL
jgi:hypothetical protein